MSTLYNKEEVAKQCAAKGLDAEAVFAKLDEINAQIDSPAAPDVDKIGNDLANKIGDSVGTAVEKSMERFMQTIDAIDQKYLIGHDRNDSGEVDEKKENVKNFVRSVLTNDQSFLSTCRKAMTEGTNADGGFLVPEEFQADVARVMKEVGVARQNAFVIPMGSDTRNFPRLLGSVRVYYPGELVAGTHSQPILGNLSLSAKDFVALTLLSNQLIDDANIDMVGFLRDLMGEAFAEAEDQNAFLDTVGLPWTGIFDDSDVNVVLLASGNDTIGEVTADDFLDMQTVISDNALGGSRALTGGKYYLNFALLSVVRKLKDEQNNYIYQKPQDGNPATLWDKPIVWTSVLPGTGTEPGKKIAAFGDLSKYYVIGDRRQMTMDSSNSATITIDGTPYNAFQNNGTIVRMTQRAGGAPLVPQALSVMKLAG